MSESPNGGLKKENISKTISYENQLKSNVNLGACLSYHCSSSTEDCNFSEIPLKSEAFAPM